MAPAVLDRALTFNPNAAVAWTIRGIIHAGRNQPEAAIEACNRAQRLSPFDLVALQQRMQDILGTKVDLMTRNGIHPRRRPRIEASAVRVF
jgi:regulator of sirC expression with transglutaminase-like and TPR domain